MNNNFWTYISACASVVLGWLLNEFGQWFRIRREDKKIKRKVLFFLLETLHRFKQLDTTKVIDFITDKILLRLPEEDRTIEGREQLKTLYNKLIPKIFESEAEINLSELEDGYKKSIEELSYVDPISAYRLKGKTKITESFKQLSDYFIHIKDVFPQEKMVIDYESNKLIENLRPQILTSAIEDIQVEIKKISFSIGLITYLRSKSVLDSSNIDLDYERTQKMEEFLDKYLPQM